MNAKDKARDYRYQKKYGITLDEYNQRLADQGGGCWICGRKPNPNGPALHVDHDHKVRKAKIAVTKLKTNYPPIYSARSVYKGTSLEFLNPSRQKAVQLLKQRLMRMSLRGLLCWACNAGLARWKDNPDRMERAARYLRQNIYKSVY